MKKLSVLVLVLALTTVVLSACQKKQTAGQQLDSAIGEVDKAATDMQKSMSK